MIYQDVLLIALGVAQCLLLERFAVRSEKNISSLSKLCWLIPSVTALVIMLNIGFEPLMAGAYLGCAGLAAGFFREDVKSRRITSAVCAAVMLISVPCCLLSDAYRARHDFTGDFKKAVSSMRLYYPLTQHKDIDFDALYEKYIPEFRKADKDRDEVENYIAWARFCAEFHDGHVGYAPNDEDTVREACKRAGGNDYGLVILKLSDGSFTAVNVDDSLANKGIHLGTQIISWNGETPDKADERSTLAQMENIPDADNAEFHKGMFAAGTGGDTAELTFIADDGSEQTVTLPKLGGCYYDRFEEMGKKLYQGYEAAHMSVTKINDTTAVLRVKSMVYDSVSASKDNHTGMKLELRDKVRTMMDEGVTDIIIDIRSNGGGSGDMTEAIASLFAPEGEHYYVTNALWDDKKGCYATDGKGGYLPDDDIVFSGDNILGENGRIVLLVNDHSASASDHLTKVMSSFDNVTVMGFTGPNGSAQGVCSKQLTEGTLNYSGSVMLDRDGSIFIDSGKDRQSTDDTGVKIPLDSKAIQAIFADGQDYLLNCAIEEIASHKG
ncbi:carboxyl-terminal processing protease [Ruminococcus sp. YE71]|uniref:S41 family peptidase n=1 Tax=unclassified Ruminococcus TaxID=2608920 RepID=UPI000890A0A7|nr:MULTISPECIES: S41 family peptidase [unclassified Ruminococcus]SDA21930.1 carboxyl-terminal processing protease [Ruminococcus sp. YE78]SFW37155.1 carboxyl-terminal processing protease [Ruminococcus sp. YE71]